MKCPKCKQYQLKQHDSLTPDFRNQAPYFCSKCSGIWVADEGIKILPDICNVLDCDSSTCASSENPDQHTGLCPVGHGLLTRAKIDVEPQFYLERCTTCGGIWFDKGEWNRIIENHLLQNLQDFWTHAWQRKQRQEKSRKSYLELHKNILGDELFNAVMNLAEKLNNHPEKIRAMALIRNEVTLES